MSVFYVLRLSCSLRGWFFCFCFFFGRGVVACLPFCSVFLRCGGFLDFASVVFCSGSNWGKLFLRGPTGVQFFVMSFLVRG